MDLSILICVYNTERELFEQTLRSIVGGTLGGSKTIPAIKYEIVVVDDGSSIDYSDLVQKYSLRYINTENRGIFCARLLAIEMAEGRYMAFVDSDDTVSFNYHRPMLEEAMIGGADIVMNDWAFHTERSRYCCMADETVSTEIREENDAVLYRFTKGQGRYHSYYVLWNKLYRGGLLKECAELAKECASRFGKLSFGEDSLINFFAYKNARSLRNIHTGYYFYRIHSSQTVNVVSEEKLAYQIDCMSYVLRTMMESVPKDNVYRSKICENIKEWGALMSRSHYSHAFSRGAEGLYDRIKQAYGVDVLRRATVKDGSGYGKNLLLGDNFTEVDKALMELYRSEEHRLVDPSGASAYVKENLSYIRSQNKNVELSKSGARLPKQQSKLKNRIIMSSAVYKLGMILFPKGSRIRAILKKKL